MWLYLSRSNMRCAALRVLVLLFAVLPVGVEARAQPQTPDSPEVSPHLADAEAPPLYESLLLPGRGQLYSGAERRGALLATAAFLTVLSLGGAQWLYARETEQAFSLQEAYMAGVDDLFPLKEFTDSAGYVTRWAVYSDWLNAYDDAKDMRRIRTFTLAAVGAVYLANATDVLLARRRLARVRPSVSCARIDGGCSIGATVNF